MTTFGRRVKTPETKDSTLLAEPVDDTPTADSPVTLVTSPEYSDPQPTVQPEKINEPKSATVPVLDMAKLEGGEQETQKSVDSEPLPRQGPLDEKLQEIKVSVFNYLIEAVDLSQLASLEHSEVREEISDIASEIIGMRGFVLSAQEQQHVIEDICNDVLGLGPLEPLLARDDITDIMVNGPDKVYIETKGKLELTDVKFRDAAQLMNVCQRIVTAVGRRVDEASPICDARLLDGSRVNVIAHPLSVDGATLTIRKFQKEKLTLDNLIDFKSVSPECAQVLEVIGGCRLNILVSGGTGSGKTTLLNCLTNFIEDGERVVTCEDAAELQLKNPHVVRLETRPANLEGAGEVTMRDLVRNCLRMRPERIIVGEVRGSEAFDLLQAMNTGHDGSMGTVHANNPREGISRIENMIAMGGFNLPAKAMREQIASAINVVVQAARLRDGSRKITHVTEVIGMEGDVVTMQDLFVFEIEGEDADGNIIGQHKATGLRPTFWDKARYFGLEEKLANALEASNV